MLMEVLALPSKSFISTLEKKKHIFLDFHYNGDNSYLFVNGEKMYKFIKAKIIFFKIFIIMLIVAIYSLMEKKSISL